MCWHYWGHMGTQAFLEPMLPEKGRQMIKFVYASGLKCTILFTKRSSSRDKHVLTPTGVTGESMGPPSLAGTLRIY